MTQAHLRAGAQRDVEEAVAFYRGEAGAAVALDFVDSLEAAIRTLGDHPPIGSLRFAYELEIHDLRSWPTPRLPDVVFYRADNENIDNGIVDIWRVLHARRDILGLLSGELAE